MFVAKFLELVRTSRIYLYVRLVLTNALDFLGTVRFLRYSRMFSGRV